MSDAKHTDYASAGVDIAAANDWIEDMSSLAKATPQRGVLSGIGGFSAQYELPSGMQQPVLVSATDGVGTKLKLALLANQHHSMGIDLVAMCVNDIITCGAKPLYFLDYYATDKLDPRVATEIISGISWACQQCDMALIGGETAEMPGCYPSAHYDLAGFSVGAIDKCNIIDGSSVIAGDQIIALSSSGVHANGFSLVRHILQQHNIDPRQYKLQQQSLCDLLLTPTELYVQTILQLLPQIPVKAIAHITGGGIVENLPRVLPQNVHAVINNSYPIPAIFNFLQELAKVSDAEMRRTFNLGVGMTIVVAKDELEDTLALLPNSAWHLGHIAAGKKQVIYQHG